MALLTNPDEIMTRRTLDTPDGEIKITELSASEPGAARPVSGIFSDHGEAFGLALGYGWQAAYFRGQLAEDGTGRNQLTIGKPIYVLQPNGDIEAQLLQAAMSRELHRKVEVAADKIIGGKGFIDTMLPTILARITEQDGDIELVLCPSGTNQDDYVRDDMAVVDDHVLIEETVGDSSPFPVDEESMVRGLFRSLSEYSLAMLRAPE